MAIKGLLKPMTGNINASFHFIHEVLQPDLKKVQDFLIENKLKASIHIDANSLYYFIQNNGEITGTIGAEFNQNYALIRAAGVAQQNRNQGTGKMLFQKLAAELEARGIIHFYLFSRQAGEFWSKLGFTQCPVQEVIRALPDALQVVEFLADNSIWTDVAWHKPVKTAPVNLSE